MYLHLVHKIF